MIDTNVKGTLYLIQRVGRDTVAARVGSILIKGSIAGFMPGTYQAVYKGTKALLDSFSFALRHELEDTGVSVTCLMPGATETDFFERADMIAADIAQIGFDAMMKREGDVSRAGRTSCRLRSRTSCRRARSRRYTRASRSRAPRSPDPPW